MAEANFNLYLNPITLESQMFLQALELYGPKNQIIDGELLNVMDKLVDAINGFYDQCTTKIQESEQLKFVKVKDFSYIQRNYNCGRCQKFLGPSAEKAAKHVTDCICVDAICNKTNSKISKPSRKERKEMRKKTAKQTAKTAKIPNQPEVLLPKKTRALLTDKVSKFFREPLKTAETLKKIPIYDEIEKDLLAVIEPLYPESTIILHKFGSRICGIGSENSDLDIFIDIDNKFNTFENRASQRTKDTIRKVCDALRKEEKWLNILAIENARVPIIRTVHQNSRISCDLGFSNSLGPCNTLLMEYYFELQPIASRMCIYLKKWNKSSKLNDVFSTYSLTLMIIFFLQQKQLLPSFLKLQKHQSDEEQQLIGPWISNFKKLTLAECDLQPVLEPTKENFRNIMSEFFLFIGNFEFDKYVICPYFGEAIGIKFLPGKLPKRYADFVASNGPQSELQLDKPCVVQDPIQLNHNTTKSVSATMLKLFKNFINESARILAENLDKEDNEAGI